MDRTPGLGAFVGEIHAAILSAFGAVGAVTNGAVRDLPGIERLGFRLFSSSVSVSHAYAHIVEIGGIVEVAGLRIADGDLLHGDQHGIVQIPHGVADRIPSTVEQLQQRERQILKYCHSTDFTITGLKAIASGSPCAPEDPQNLTNPGARPR
jgi:regulator of RNase E activity RraA